MVLSTEQSELLTLDLLWSYFMAALNSYRYDSILRPFPKKFVNPSTQEKDLLQLQKVASEVPPVPKLMNHGDDIEPEIIELFNWVTNSSNFKLMYKDISEFQSIKELTKQIAPAAEPNLVFEVVHSENRELKFQEMKNEFGSVYAYHGSKLENFYSILRNGFVSHMCKNGAFGSGTYFSSELSVSLLYSFSSKGWEKSLLGSELSCVAVCEIIKDPSVKFKVTGQRRLLSCDIINEKVPDKYYVVFNNDLVLLRYLLVYTFGSSKKKKASKSWWRKHTFSIFVICYLLILCAVMLSR